MSKKKGSIKPIIPRPTNKIYEERDARSVRRVSTPIVADSPEFIPEYKTKGSACCDLRANLGLDPRGERKLTIAPGYTELVDCGFSIALPAGYEAQIRARSGLAAKGLIVTNATEEQEGGTIDDDYRFRLKVILTNVGRSIVTLNHLDRIAQMAVRPCWYFEFDPTDTLPESEDRVGGFGSTGVE